MRRKFKVDGPVEVRLIRCPGKKGMISCYPDSWRVEMAFDQGTKIVPLSSWTEDKQEAEREYKRLADFFGKNVLNRKKERN